MIIKVQIPGSHNYFRMNTVQEEIRFYNEDFHLPGHNYGEEVKPIANDWSRQRIEFRHDDARYMVQWNPSWEMIPASVKTFRVTLEDIHSLVESD